MKDLDRRRRVMERSIRLGHCICDPKKACPCELFRRQDVCLCAGERLEFQEAASGPLRLTRLVESAGCASKIDQAALKRALAGLPSVNDPRVLVGMAAGDDAGVYRLDGNLALVQTVDVFAPSVDDPYEFGQVAAANSLSDVYAMGGRPLTALSIVGFPVRVLPDGVLQHILRGGVDKMAEAGVPVIGGHSIRDDQIKAGFAVTGLVDPQRMVTNAGARSGDVLVLTKPLGTGIVAFAAQIDRAPEGSVAAACRSMVALNRIASELMVELGAHACTDVTGFGLTGHLAEMASASGVDVQITWDDLPLLPGVLECVAQGIVPGAAERNRESSGDRLVAEAGIELPMLEVLFDPQTSGGLLIAVPADAGGPLVARLHDAGIREAAVIGAVRGAGTGRVFLQTRGARLVPFVQEARTAREASRAGAASMKECCMEPEAEEACCAGGHGAGAAGLEERFHEFLQAASAPGALDARTKRAVAIALSVLARCEPCLKAHTSKAREMGMSDAEIDEAAWMAVSFGGCPAMMFYNAARRK